MRILFIWDGLKPLPESRAEAIASTMNLYPDAEYFCITKLHHFFSPAFTVISWDNLRQEMVEYLGLKAVPYRWYEPMVFSDWARFYWLGNHGGTLYLDTDARMLKRHEFGDKVEFSPGNICLLYSPESENKSHFHRLLKGRQRINLLVDMYAKMDPAWSSPVPEDCFRHR